MPQFHAGEFVKAEFKDDTSGENEWMWVRVESCDDKRQVLFGSLDSVPVVHTQALKLGSKVALSYSRVRGLYLDSAFLHR
jgi:hypothetical protein